jgi:hypothetical protein
VAVAGPDAGRHVLIAVHTALAIAHGADEAQPIRAAIEQALRRLSGGATR